MAGRIYYHWSFSTMVNLWLINIIELELMKSQAYPGQDVTQHA